VTKYVAEGSRHKTEIFRNAADREGSAKEVGVLQVTEDGALDGDGQNNNHQAIQLKKKYNKGGL